MISASAPFGQLFVAQRVEDDHLGAGGGQQFGLLGVAEGECGTGGDSDPDRGRPPTERWRIQPGRGAGVELGSGLGEAQHRVEVDALGHHAAQFGHGPGRLVAALGGRHQTQMPGRGRQGVLPPDRAEHGHRHGLHALEEHLVVPIGADPVEDHPRDADRRVESRQAVHDRGRRASRAARVHDEHHRRLQQSAPHGRSTRIRPRPRGAVEQSHHAFDDRDVGRHRSRRAVHEQRRDQVLADQPRIEVAARPARRPGRDNRGRCSRGRPCAR